MAGDYFILQLEVASVLVECGFVSNAEEEKRLLEAAYQQQIAQAIAIGVEEYRRSGGEFSIAKCNFAAENIHQPLSAKCLRHFVDALRPPPEGAAPNGSQMPCGPQALAIPYCLFLLLPRMVASGLAACFINAEGLMPTMFLNCLEKW